MKKYGIVYAGLVSILLMGIASVGYAQKDDQGKGGDNHAKQDRHTQGGPAVGGQQQQGHDQRHAQGEQPTRNDRREPANTAQQRVPRPQTARGDGAPGHAQGQQAQQHGSWQPQRATHFDTQHQTWAQRGGYHGYRVPNDQFSRSFGTSHSFRLAGLPYGEFGGHPRFEYGGYWLSMMEPYPEYWGPDWNRNDDMYVDFNGGGYYLYDRRFPGRPGVALSITF